MSSPPIRNLTIFLIKSDLQHDSIISKVKSRKYRFFDIGQQRYHIYAKSRRNHEPAWASFFENRLNTDFIWTSDAPSLVLLVETGGRIFALTFGFGRHLLMSDCFDERFGLLVVLNTVDKVRSLDKKTFDAISGQTRTQANRFSDVNQFGFDIEQDLLRAVTGKPIDSKNFGEQMSGADALSAKVSVDLAGLPTLLRSFLKQSKLTRYKDNGFGFVDHLKAITKAGSRGELNKLLIEKLNERIDQLAKHRLEKNFPFDLVIPEIIDWANVERFAYTLNRSKEPVRTDISIDSFLSQNAKRFQNDVSVEVLTRSPVYALDASGQMIHHWPSYRCMAGDINHNGKRYVISDGNWYEVDSDYLQILEAFIKDIPPFSSILPLYRGGTEENYNKNAVKALKGFHNFDRKLIHPLTNQKFEYCDLYTESHDFRDHIHIKHGTSSAVLSHLFAQGTTSLEVCADYKKCRDLADDMIRKALGNAAFDDPKRPSRVRTVYGIIRPRSGKLPFFSKVNLRRACRELNRAKTEYALAEIEYDPTYLIRKS